MIKNTSRTVTSTHTSIRRLLYVDVHAHLTDHNFNNIHDHIHQRCVDSEVDFVILNGLNPPTNRRVMSLCEEHSRFLPAVGIYPLDASCRVNKDHWEGIEFDPPAIFDIEEELQFIEEAASSKKIIAVGECGLDRKFIKAVPVMEEQERVLRRLMNIAKEYDIPIILHSRKAEGRVFEMLQEEGVSKAIFHCFTGKVKLGKRISSAGYYLSIPPAITRIPSFQHLARTVPLCNILTETDSPYMSAEKSTINEPCNVTTGVKTIADLRNTSESDVAKRIRENFFRLFGI